MRKDRKRRTRRKWDRYGADFRHVGREEEEEEESKHEERQALVLRVVSPNGLHRIELGGRKSMTELRNMIWTRTGINPKDQQLFIDRHGEKKLESKWDLLDGLQIFVLSRQDRLLSSSSSSSSSSSPSSYDAERSMHSLKSLSHVPTRMPSGERLARKENSLSRCYALKNLSRGQVIRPPDAVSDLPQEYSHIEGRVLMEEKAIHSFLGPWLASARTTQRCGVVIGSVDRNGNIHGSFVFEGQENDKDLTLAEKVAKRMGLQIVGCIFSCCATFDEKKCVAEAARLQLRFRNFDAFVTVLAFETDLLFAFAVSDSVVGFVRDNANSPSSLHSLSWKKSMLKIGTVRLKSTRFGSDRTESFPVACRDSLINLGLRFESVHENADLVFARLRGLCDYDNFSLGEMDHLCDDFHFLFALAIHLGSGAVRAMTEARSSRKESLHIVNSLLERDPITRLLTARQETKSHK